MKLNKIPKNELELLSYTEIAKMYLDETKKTLNTANLFKEICNLLETNDYEDTNQIADFFQSLTTSKDFILLEDGNWDLKANHKIKVSIDEIYDDTMTEQEENEDTDEEIDENEEESIDTINNDDDFLNDDTEDDLSELTIINDEEIEE